MSDLWSDRIEVSDLTRTYAGFPVRHLIRKRLIRDGQRAGVPSGRPIFRVGRTTRQSLVYHALWGSDRTYLVRQGLGLRKWLRKPDGIVVQ